MAGNNPYNLPGLLANAYQDPTMSAMGGASRAMAPMMGYTDKPTSIGQMLAAAGGGAVQGQQQANQSNINMGLMQQQIADAKAARESATQQATALSQLGAQLGLPPGTPPNVILEAVKARNASSAAGNKYGSSKVMPDPNSSTGYSYVQTSGAGANRTVGEAPAPSGGVTVNLGEGGNALSKTASSRIDTLWGDIDTVDTSEAKLNNMMGLAAQTPTGQAADWRLWAGKWAGELGFNVDMENINSLEQFKVAQMDFVMDRIASTKGSISEKEMEAFKQAGPNLMNTPRGNMLITKVMLNSNKRKRELAQMEIGLLNDGVSRTEAYNLTRKRSNELSKVDILSPDDMSFINSSTGNVVHDMGNGVTVQEVVN